jgi:hypothetical protein
MKGEMGERFDSCCSSMWRNAFVRGNGLPISVLKPKIATEWDKTNKFASS